MIDCFPDGTPIEDWFLDTKIPSLEELGTQYLITEYGVRDDGKVYTTEIQNLIDKIARKGGGVMVVPPGTYMTGAIHLKQGVNLYLSEGAVLKGSDDISDYKVVTTRIEGQTCKYIEALINAEGLNSLKICGTGTIDGNGMRSWKAFWQRREWNPECTNKDEQRARLLFLSNCSDVVVSRVNMINSQFWTNHLYKCNHVKYLHCRIYSPTSPVKAPSTDAIDIDACEDVLVKNCYMEVNDDAIALKGGKGIDADKRPENGKNERIIIEDCVIGFAHGGLTCGSENVHSRNIIFRRNEVKDAFNLLWLKDRPDTPQIFEYITVEEIKGQVDSYITLRPWKQFNQLKGGESIAPTVIDHVTIKNCDNCHALNYTNVMIDNSYMTVNELNY